MSDIDQYVAAAIIQFAANQRDGISVPVADIFDIPRVHFDWAVDQAQITAAIEILRNIGVADVSNDQYAGTFIAIGERSFSSLWRDVKGDEADLARKLAQDEFFAGDDEDMLAYPSLLIMRPYEVLKRYGQFGTPWLNAALDRLRVDVSSETSGDAISISSSDWTGRYEVSDNDKIVVETHLKAIEAEIEVSKLTNSKKAEARADIRAAQNLLESPNPAWAIIVKLLSSPILANVTAIAALAVAVIKGP